MGSFFIINNSISKDYHEDVILEFVDSNFHYLPSTDVLYISECPVEVLPDGCVVYNMSLDSEESPVLYEIVLNPDQTEVVNLLKK